MHAPSMLLRLGLPGCALAGRGDREAALSALEAALVAEAEARARAAGAEAVQLRVAPRVSEEEAGSYTHLTLPTTFRV